MMNNDDDDDYLLLELALLDEFLLSTSEEVCELAELKDVISMLLRAIRAGRQIQQAARQATCYKHASLVQTMAPRHPSRSA